MIHFDANKLTTEIVRLKAVTTILGGSIQIVDEDKTVGKKEILKRIEVPLAVARSFIQKSRKITKYLKPTLTCLVWYDDMVIAMERHPLSSLGVMVEETPDGPKPWVPSCVIIINSYLIPLTLRGSKRWYFDGRYVYSFANDDIPQTLASSTYLTSNGQFRQMDVQAMDMQEIAVQANIAPSNRHCLAFVASTGDYAVSPPIWKNLGQVGSTKLIKGDDDENDDVVISAPPLSFDRIDNQLSVNLNFALAAGDKVGRTFGYDHVEPLQLARLMIELSTVNLPNVPKQVKATYDINMQFTHIVAWLLGLIKQTDSLKTYLAMRSLLKYLTSKGIYKKDAFVAENVFRGDQTVADVALKTLDDLLDSSAATNSIASMVAQQLKNVKNV